MIPCRRCLLEDISGQEDVLRKIRESVAALPAWDRAEAQVMQARLEACRMCPHLDQGTCGRCGCYVELRAALKQGRCPDVPGRW